MSVRVLAASEAEARRRELCEVLIDCVEGGASVGFMAPLPLERADRYWREIEPSLADGRRQLFVAEAGGRIEGTVQLVVGQPDNQPHRADISKLLVRGLARGKGLGAALMRAADEAAIAAGKTLLVLDTASPEAARLYEREGWIKVGVIPGYALMPEGAPCDTAYYYKRL